MQPLILESTFNFFNFVWWNGKEPGRASAAEQPPVCLKKSHTCLVFSIEGCAGCFFPPKSNFYLKEWQTIVIPLCVFDIHITENAHCERIEVFQVKPLALFVVNDKTQTFKKLDFLEDLCPPAKAL